MGKCKQRLRARAKNEKYQLKMTREEALSFVSNELCDDPSSIPARKLITLFGLKAEEMSEAGVTYEVLRSLDGLIS
ncbi:MAG: hypothetical protein A2287_03810 [Candidatus Melainabacteria bacterium RIFOXYA12_FULL_32_12]|nr:MAG: hypothetical protein A2255_04745 [Candidatus Melainabacteria bacterium RIFOXYA2_FULL_32_9]OGI25710.1 MAG: hypothetical protein A2287_03810 [Candidatus Melainabacteria bacterium RIFOXYA12_FULL_32_12]